MLIDYKNLDSRKLGVMLVWAYLDEGTNDLVAVCLEWYGVGSFWRVNGEWSNRLENDDDIRENSYMVFIDPTKAQDFLDKWDTEDSELPDQIDFYEAPKEVYYTYFPITRREQDQPVTASVKKCPPATQDIIINVKNRNKAINSIGYGPLNPLSPNEFFWKEKAELWSITTEEAKKARCGNCAMFNTTSSMIDCIEKGLSNNKQDSWDLLVNTKNLGYCEAFDFKCSSLRTCDAWVVGGPISDED